MRKELNSHGRHFIVLEHQYGRRDVMWKRSIARWDLALKFLWKAFRTRNSQICSCISKSLRDVSAGLEKSSCARSCNVWQWRKTVVYVLLHDCVNVRVCNLHRMHHTGHIGNYKLHTVHLRSVALLLSNSVLVQFFGWQTQADIRLRSVTNKKINDMLDPA